MKHTYLLLTALAIGFISCNDSGKSAEDIEQEYTAESGATHQESNTVTGAEIIEATETETVEVVDLTQFVYFEDFAKLDTKTKLYEAYGAENLVDGSSWFAEGTVEFQTTTLTDPNTLNVYYYMWDQEDNETLSFLEAPGFVWDENYEVARRQVIESKEGIFTGMSLKDLHAWNDSEDFSFSGFGWDYEGGIFTNKGTKIGDIDIQIKLGLEDYTGQNSNDLMGDMELNTGDPGILDAPIIIDRFTVYPGNPEF
jgi:hypothetical protein